MHLKSLKLSNIRSYESQEISFPNGSLLLSGDIGAGKSTILLAIEFAIFGAKKGELPAYTLLRHGKKEGSVELSLSIDGKDIVIKRILKKSSNDIKQESGYIVAGGLKKEGTSEELRAWVMEMLGYPKDLIKKGKDLIYRYTVYTPQEEMKQILYEGHDVRLDTLRKVFNIDKYKKIRDNSKIIITQLREKKRLLEGFSIDLDYKLRELGERKSEVTQIDGKIVEIIPKLEEVKSIISVRKKSVANIESEIVQLQNLRKELSLAEANLSFKIEQNNRINEEIKKFEKQIEDLGMELKDKKIESDISDKIKAKDEEAEKAEQRYRILLKKIKEIEVKIDHCDETISKIKSLDICPLCSQKVNESHKHDVSQSESKKHDELVAQVRKYKDEEHALEKMRLELKKEIDSYIRLQSHSHVLKIKFENLEEKKRVKEEKMALKGKVKKEIGALNIKKTELNFEIQKYSDVEEKYKAVRKEIDELLPQERFLELGKREMEAKKESIMRFIVSIEKEILEKKKAREKLSRISGLVNWIDEFFINLMSTMEKHVMVNIHTQFNELFRSWFDILIEDETISVRIDEDFTPIIEQNGYETYIENLSGGEKTSVALAYRLALNKVVNDVVSTIKTKDIIILDEPTDGFSTEQLDKVRDLLRELNTKQVIIVSHEHKIESFVANVLRIEKRDHVSVVV